MQVIGKNIIGYTYSELFSAQFRSWNPTLNQENPFLINSCTDEDLNLSLKKAAACFIEFSNLSGKRRAAFLLRIAEKMGQNKAFLCEIFQLESALPPARAEAELQRTIFQLEEFATLISQKNWNALASDSADEERKPNPKPALNKFLVPLGPVAVFGASNFPFAYSTIGGDTASALAAGCPVIVKAHFMHAGTGDLVAQLVCESAKETGMPDGVFSNLNSSGIELGQKLLLAPEVKAVGFTGSFSGGMALHQIAQERTVPIPVFAEMGSVNPVFLLQSAFRNPNLASDLANSVSLNAGQFCTNPGLVFCLKSAESELFIAELSSLLDQTEAQLMLHPEILRKYRGKLLITEKNSLAKKLSKTKKIIDNFSYPKLFSIEFQDFESDKVWQREVFGMHTIVVQCENLVQLKSAAELVDGQLSSAIYSSEEELEKNLDLIRILEQKAGRLIFNGVPTGIEVSKAMHHGGPFPATTDPRFTAVGKDAVFRFLRPVVFQNFSTAMLNNLFT